ncbi:hypothetical protein D3C76_444670 [compost metagenome]
MAGVGILQEAFEGHFTSKIGGMCQVKSDSRPRSVWLVAFPCGLVPILEAAGFSLMAGHSALLSDVAFFFFCSASSAFLLRRACTNSLPFSVRHGVPALVDADIPTECENST